MTDIYDLHHLYSEHGNAYLRNGMILCRCLFFCKFPIIVLLVSDTHTFYKVFRLSRVPASYFGGNSITHCFGHPSDPLTSYVHVPKRAFLHEKGAGFLFSKTLLKKIVAGCTICRVWRCMVATLCLETGLQCRRRLSYS
jgi:hypothetical protein